MSDEDIPDVEYTEVDALEEETARVQFEKESEDIVDAVAIDEPTDINNAHQSDADDLEEPATRIKRVQSDADDDSDERPSNIKRVDNHTKVVAEHYNELKEKGLSERSKSRIFFMRNFNNWIKSVLINEFLTKIKETSKLGEALRVLDMCCGKGGDLPKWEKGNITHLICTDIAAVSVEQCKERYAIMVDRHQQQNKYGKMFTAEFFACDSTLQRLREHYKDPSIELNLVSCQFAFHYCFESLKQAECMIRNAAECLKPGGYFIGTIPDANDIMRRQQQCNGLAFGNDIYRIKFLCDASSPPLFGAKYNFELDEVVNCPEFLVHFPLLEKLARKVGLRLVLKERFEDFFERNKNTSKGLLEHMKALEPYPPNNRNTDNDPETSDDYAHVKHFNRGRTCGTLSKSEWEASTLYMVFAFQKMKKQYNSTGEVEYI